MKKLFAINILWGAMSGVMGYVITSGKGFVVWALGTAIFTILAWEKD